MAYLVLGVACYLVVIDRGRKAEQGTAMLCVREHWVRHGLLDAVGTSMHIPLAVRYRRYSTLRACVPRRYISYDHGIMLICQNSRPNAGTWTEYRTPRQDWCKCPALVYRASTPREGVDHLFG